MDFVLPYITQVLSQIEVPSFETFDPGLVRGLFILVFVFIIALLLGFSRHYIASNALSAAWTGFLMGAIILGGLEAGAFFFYQQYIIGEKRANLPQNVQVVLDDGRQSVNRVLGIESEEKEKPTAQSVVSDYKTLLPLDAELAQGSICKEK